MIYESGRFCSLQERLVLKPDQALVKTRTFDGAGIDEFHLNGDDIADPCEKTHPEREGQTWASMFFEDLKALFASKRFLVGRLDDRAS